MKNTGETGDIYDPKVNVNHLLYFQSSMFETLSTSQQVVDEPTSVEARSKSRRPVDVEIDCTHPQIEIRVSPRHRRSVTSSTTETSQSRTSTTTETTQRRSSSQLQQYRESEDPGSSSRFQPDTHSSRFESLRIKVQSVQ